MYNEEVRTTIEMKPEHRAKLLEIAARRGQKGFSSVIAEAIETYLHHQQRRAQIRHTALRTGGRLTSKDAEVLREKVSAIRAHWR